MTNPFRLLGLYRKADVLVSVLNDGAKDSTNYRNAAWWTRLLTAGSGLAAAVPIAPNVRMQMQKAFWKSKTLWFNVASLAVAVAGGSFGIPVPPNVAVPVIAIGNFVLRLMTDAPVGATDQPAK